MEINYKKHLIELVDGKHLEFNIAYTFYSTSNKKRLTKRIEEWPEESAIRFFFVFYHKAPVMLRKLLSKG